MAEPIRLTGTDSENRIRTGNTSPERKKYSPRFSNRTKMIAGGAALLLAGAAGATIWTINDIREDKESEREKVEAETIKDMRDDDPELLGSTVVLHEGVKIRRTPDMVENSLFTKSNVDEEVPNNNLLVINNPIRLDQPDGEVWIGFTLDESGMGKQTDADLASHLLWVNLGAVELQGANTDDTMVEYFDPDSQAWTQQVGEATEGRIAFTGKITADGSSGPVAIGDIVPSEEIDRLMAAFGVDIKS